MELNFDGGKRQKGGENRQVPKDSGYSTSSWEGQMTSKKGSEYVPQVWCL